MGKWFGGSQFTNNGPGVSKNGPEKKRFFLFFEIYFRKFTKIILLNLIYVAMCIPIVTIGPANAGMAYCMRNFAREDHAEISDFFEQFKKNFWQAFVVNLIFTIGFGIIVYGIFFYYAHMSAGSAIAFFGFVASCMAGIIFLFMSYYVYMIMVTFKQKLRQILKNAAIFAFVGLGRNLITSFFMLIINGWFFIYGIYPVLLPLFDTEAPVFLEAVCLAFALYIFFIPSLCAFIVNFNVYPNVKKYMIDPALAEKQAEETEQIFEDRV